MFAPTFPDVARNLSGWDNATLLEYARQGSPLAWEELLHRYQGLVHSVARSFGLQPMDVADVAQVTWLRLVEKMHTIRDPERLSGWLAIIATRECIRLYHKNSALSFDPSEHDIPDSAADPETTVSDGDVAERLWAAVAELPSRQRTLLTALFRDELDSYDAVSEKFSMPIGSIGPTRARALARLRDKLAGSGLGPRDL
jgi:RNA polymerase sigma factor (sigma-70 family)